MSRKRHALIGFGADPSRRNDVGHCPRCGRSLCFARCPVCDASVGTKSGLGRPPRKVHWRKRMLIAQLVRRARSYAEIAEIVGLPKTTLYEICQRDPEIIAALSERLVSAEPHE